MATIQWLNGSSGNGSRGTSGLNVTLSGDQIPSNAVVTNVQFSIGLSVASPAGSYTRLYYVATTDRSTFFIGNSSYTDTSSSSNYYKREKVSEFNNHGYYNGNNGLRCNFEQNLNYFNGQSSGTIRLRANNNGSGTSYVRGVDLVFTYYAPCGNASNVVAAGGLKSLSATWTRGASGVDDTPTYEVCYNTSQTWNDSTASVNSGTSASWTITTAGTYYVGVRAIGASSGAHSPVWSSGVYVSAFVPTLVTAGNKIVPDNYNQIRVAYSGLGAVSSGSIITKAQIDAIRAYNTNVVATSAGTKITADYFNNNVLNKIK